MRLLTGDECGWIKECIPETGRPKKIEGGPSNQAHPVSLKGMQSIDPTGSRPRRARGVVGKCFLDDSASFGGTSSSSTSTATSPLAFAALRVDNTVEVWDRTDEETSVLAEFGEYRVRNTIDFRNRKQTNGNVDAGDGNGAKDGEEPQSRSIGIGSFPQHDRLCVADSLGRVSILHTSKGSVVSTYPAFGSSKRGSTLTYTKGGYQNNHVCTAMLADTVRSRIVCSGRERETTMLDVATGKEVWKAKNLPPDPQTLLQQPVWTTAMEFLSSTSSESRDNVTLVAGTAYKQVRLYDVRVDAKQRRPVAFTPEGWLDHRITSLCALRDQHTVAIGDAAGYLFALDTRMILGNNRKKKRKSGRGEALPRFVGPTGSIRHIVQHPKEPILACVGLDRMLRTYHTEKRTQIDCMYMKQRLNCVLMFEDRSWDPEDSADGGTDEKGDADLEDRVQDYVDSDDDEDDDGDDEEENDEMELDGKRGEENEGEDSDADGGEDSDSDEDGSDSEGDDGSDDDEDDDDDDSSDEEDDDSDNDSHDRPKVPTKKKARR